MYRSIRTSAEPGESLSRRVAPLATQGAALLLTAFIVFFLRVPLAAETTAEATPPPPPSELVEYRTVSSRTFDNHDGTYTTAAYSGPIHYRDEQGRFQPISSALVASGEAGYAYENEANRFRALFRQASGADYLALESWGGRRFRLRLQDAAQSSAQTRPRGLSYPAVFPGVDLRYELQPDGVKETLLLANAQVPTSYRFLLSTPQGARIHAVQQSDGSWALFMAPYARPALVIEAPWLSERGDPAPAAPHASLDLTRVGQDFQLDLSLDGAWLSDPQRQFPVRVDPSLTIQPPTQDASFDFACLTCAGVASDRLPIGKSNISPSPIWRSALQFSLADIPAGVTVSSATLKLYFDGTCVPITGATCGGTSHQVDALRMTSSWSKNSKTSQLFFTDPNTPLASFTLPSGAAAQWMNWDITPTVRDWALGNLPNFGLLLKRATEPTASSGPKPPSRGYAPEPTLGPKLEVTYNGNGGELLAPETLHSNGAELRWIPYSGPGAPQFTNYEVHRSTSQGFTPSSTTRLTTIKDAAVTSYRDTTAKAGTTFTYKVLSSGVETNRQTVTLPASGQALKTLRPDPQRGHDTYFTYRSDLIDCTNRGAFDRVRIGTDVNSIWRSLLWFDVHDIPPSATVSAATLSLWHPNVSTAAVTVRSHRVTAAWDEGSGGNGVDACSGDGATWYETKGGVRWATDGGDFDPTVVSSLAVPSGQAASWNAWTLTSLVQQWMSGTKPNSGVLLKLDNETIVAGKYLDYYSSDFAVAPTLRPKLSITYADGSQPIAPTVSIGKPAPSTQVSGSSVEITAGASDDRRIDSVQFFADGNSIGTDASEPFSISWNSTGVGNGSHSLTARATDDAGNQTTSAAVSVSVGNATPPTTAITAPAANATVTGTVTVAASASTGVTKVEFYADGALFATDTTSPYSVSWNTLDPALPAYDGSHALTTKAYDAFAQVTTSAPRSVTAVNTTGTLFRAGFSSSAFPVGMEYDPSGPPQEQYPIDVTVTNLSGTSWATTGPSAVILHYRWFTIGSTTPVTDSSDYPLGTVPIPPGGQAIVHALVTPPTLPPGLARADYRLRFDLLDGASGFWFAAKGNSPLEQPLPVGTLSAEEKLGIEPYFQYDSEDLGAGMQNLVNVATGNSVIQWTPFQAPGRGLSTKLGLTYNSMEGDCQPVRCPVGPGWSLAVSSLTRFGHQQFTVDSPGQPRAVTLRDDDGTTHVFTSTDGDHWTAPAGTHLYLRKVGAQWALTSPDRVTYLYTMDGLGQHGFPATVTDGNGNQLTFTTNSPAEVSRVADDADRQSVPDRHFDLLYNGDHTLKSISDHLGHKLLFTYETNEHHRLSDITEDGGTNADGTLLLPRAFHFAYEGSGPPQNRQLVSVLDPRSHTTTFVYNGDDKLVSRTNRQLNPPTTFSYPGANQTIVSAPPNRQTTYTSDGEGKVTEIARQIGTRSETTTMAWTQTPPLRHLARVTEPHELGIPGAYTKYTYNLNGLMTEQAVLVDPFGAGEGDDLLSRTLSEYDDLPVPGGDPNVLAISQLRKRTDPNGAATPAGGDYEWNYTYDPAGNLRTITDPTAAVTTNNWNTNGTLASVQDANHHTTSFPSHDANGFATQVVDAKGQTTRYSYDAAGLLRSRQDPLHASDTGTNEREYMTVLDYDSFHRLGRQSSPKSTRFRGQELIWSSTEYDPNNNVVVARQPASFAGGGAHTDTEYDNVDRRTIVTGPDRSNGLETTRYEYDEAGRLWRTTLPRGFYTQNANDFVTQNAYDQLDRILTETRFAADGIATRKTDYCYRYNTGDLLWMIAPKADRSQPFPNCSDTPPPTPPAYTTRYTYDAAHRQLSETEPLDGPSTRTHSQAYDLNGNVTQETNELGTSETLVYNQRNEVVQTIETFTSSPLRELTTASTYDRVGNLICQASPRAWDSGSRCDPEAPPDSEPYISEYRYDAVDQLDRIALPDDSNNIRTYIHRQYDANGNLTLTTLPVENPELSSPPTIGDDKKTTIDYFDPGWIYSAWDHVAPIVYYDYRPEGWQSLRAPLSPANENAILWKHYDDGLVSGITDTYNNPGATYTYDADGNLTTAVERRGRTRPLQTPYSIFSDYNGYDELTETRQKQDADAGFRYTDYRYDPNGNVEKRWDSGAAPEVGREQDFTYDEADQLTGDHDWGADRIYNTSDDQQVRFAYSLTGWQQQRTIERWNPAGLGSWVLKQTADSTYYDNGDLKTLQTRNGATPTPALLESHTLEYIDTGIYLNGNRTKDTFRLQGTNGATCENEDCSASYTYGPRENLTTEQTRRPSTGSAQTRSYGYDFAMNLNHEVDGPGGYEWWYVHAGNRLTERQYPQYQAERRYFYDERGNLNCVTTANGSSGDCSRAFGAPTPPKLLESDTWDYLNRLDHATRFGNGLTSDDADYEHDPLNRVAKETETHSNGVGNRRTCFTYLGLSSDVSQEAWVATADPCTTTPMTTRSYSYDANDERVGMTKTGGADSGDYYYARNVHTDVSLLERDNQTTKASYVYKPYGAEDGLSDGDPEGADALNAFRFNDKRLDSGSATLDMGARRYNSAIDRFIQEDFYTDSFEDRDLATDLYTQNRYIFAAANPTNHVEIDGHRFPIDEFVNLFDPNRHSCKFRQHLEYTPADRLIEAFGQTKCSHVAIIVATQCIIKRRYLEVHWRGRPWCDRPRLDVIMGFYLEWSDTVTIGHYCSYGVWEYAPPDVDRHLFSRFWVVQCAQDRPVPLHRLSTMVRAFWRKPSLVLGALVLCAVIGAFVVSTEGTSRDLPSATPAMTSPEDRIRFPDDESEALFVAGAGRSGETLMEKLGLFRRPSTRADALSQAASRDLEHVARIAQAEEPGGIEPHGTIGILLVDHSRLVISRLGSIGAAFYAVPTSGGFVCYSVTKGIGGACVASLTSGASVTIVQPDADGPLFIYGLLRDGIGDVTIRLEHSAEHAVIGENGFFRELTGVPLENIRRLEVTAETGARDVIPITELLK